MGTAVLCLPWLDARIARSVLRMLILIYTGEKPNGAMEQIVWYEFIGLASLEELEVFIKSRSTPAPAKRRL